MSLCRQWLGDATYCRAPANEVRVMCPGGRRDVTVAYCSDHGGVDRATAEAHSSWFYLAPASVGNEEAVLDAGNLGLTSVNVYVVVRQLPAANGGKWIVQLGIGGLIVDIKGEKKSSGRSGKGGSFPSMEDAYTAGIEAWRKRLDEDFAAIKHARGGTMDWGLPVSPLAEPIVLFPEIGQSAYAADRVRRILGLSPHLVTRRVACPNLDQPKMMGTEITGPLGSVVVDDRDIVWEAGRSISTLPEEDLARRLG